MPLKVVPLQRDARNIQIIQISSGLSNFNKSVGKYALIPVDNGASYLCKLFTSKEVHPAYVDLDKSVVHVSEKLPNGLPSVPVRGGGAVNDPCIKILPPPTNISSVTVTIVLESVFDISHWRRTEDMLSCISKHLLKLFVVSQNSVVYLENLPTEAKHGIYAIIINSIVCDGGGEIGWVSSQTKVTIGKLISKKYFMQMVELSEVRRQTLPRQPYQLLKGIIDLKTKWSSLPKSSVLSPLQNVIITGTPGSGKTTLVSGTAAEVGATLIKYSSYCTSSGNHAQNLKICFSEAKALAEEREDGICILLLENVDLICKRRDGGNISADNLCATLQLLTIMEEARKVPNLLIVATTTFIHNLDPSLRTSNTFNCEVVIEQSEEDREDILKSLLQPLIPEDYLSIVKNIAHITPGYVAADLALICHKVACTLGEKNITSPEDWLHELRKTVTETKPTTSAGMLGTLKQRLTNAQPLGGLLEVKKNLRATLQDPLNNPEAYLRLGLPLPKGLLLYGPPGCAKTSLVHSIAAGIPVTFLAVSSADLYSPFVGEAEQNIVDLFRRARSSAPTILFIDELDALVGRREGREAGVHDRVLSAFLMEMDGVSVPTTVREGKLIAENEPASVPQIQAHSFHREKAARNTTVVVIGATNRPDILDPALLRPGRFDKLVHVPAPGVIEREDILRQLTCSMPLHEDVDLKSVAPRAEFYSGADLAHLCTTAALNALTMDGMSATEIRQRHFNAALETTKPSLSFEQISWYEKFAEGS